MKQYEEGLRQWSEMIQDEQQKKWKVGEAEVNEKIGETARISRCRNKTDNISPSE